ncbi:MAG: hypothetical protein JW874_00595 [Spirochaetales bacterium]|nr:hypothetical protein [Spirochaetales bacterium]
MQAQKVATFLPTGAVKMMYVMFTLAATVLFFLFIPALGAFRVRKMWRQFRSRIIQASYFPQAAYNDIRRQESGILGNYRMFGTIQAIQDDHILWVSNKGLSITVNLDNVTIYQLPAAVYSEDSGILPDEPVRVMQSRQIGTVPQGTRALICGPLFIENGLGVFRSDGSTPVTLLIYEGDEKSILRRTIWSGRQRNEYWNPLTPGSLVIGVISLLALGYLQVRAPSLYLQAVFTFALALLPVIPFFPPGILFFFLYSVFWKRGRFFRGQRDLFMLPLRFFPQYASAGSGQSVRLPDGEVYSRLCCSSSAEAKTAVPEGYVHDLPVPKGIQSGQYHCFGIVRKKQSETLLEPMDPMVESVIVPGNPLLLSKFCMRKARKQEILSALAMILALMINFSIIFFVGYLLIR